MARTKATAKKAAAAAKAPAKKAAVKTLTWKEFQKKEWATRKAKAGKSPLPFGETASEISAKWKALPASKKASSAKSSAPKTCKVLAKEYKVRCETKRALPASERKARAPRKSGSSSRATQAYAKEYAKLQGLRISADVAKEAASVSADREEMVYLLKHAADIAHGKNMKTITMGVYELTVSKLSRRNY